MILGLDLATKKAGYSLLHKDGRLSTSGLIRTISNDTKDRMQEIYEAIKEIISNNDIDMVVFEDVPVTTHNNIKTGKDLSILQGVILSLCFENKLSYTMYNPSSWRSIIGTYDGTRASMKREIQKQKAVEVVNDMYNLGFIYNATETKTRFTDDDRAEAILIARAYIKEVLGN